MEWRTMNLFDKNQPPPNAYTRADSIRLVNEYDASWSSRDVFRSRWTPYVLWRMEGGGCHKPDPSDKSYIDGRYRFMYPGNNRRARREAARQNGRRRSVRVPILTWRWME